MLPLLLTVCVITTRGQNRPSSRKLIQVHLSNKFRLHNREKQCKWIIVVGLRPFSGRVWVGVSGSGLGGVYIPYQRITAQVIENQEASVSKWEG